MGYFRTAVIAAVGLGLGLSFTAPALAQNDTAQANRVAGNPIGGTIVKGGHNGLLRVGRALPGGAIVGSECKATRADGGPIGGIIAEDGRCVASVAPAQPGKGITEKGIK